VVEDRRGIPCVIYAAKSSEDRRGSIPEQLRECREMVEADSRRHLAAEYSDEAFSAYRRDRGPGLRDAIQHAEDLAQEYGIAELWAQHSDRLARGDGRLARHTVEVALWALKHDVRVRTLQDPETFRDLLYAVVTGQRNNEDSRRKGLASSAGRRRAAARGDYIGYKPDGYQLAVEVDEHGQMKKRLEFDPSRQPLIEMIFRLALRGKRSGAIAKAVNNAGWQTKPAHRHAVPRAFTSDKILDLLKNPRYAGLAIWNGEVVARGHWPVYITERQHQRIRQRLAGRRPTKPYRQLETYLLAKLARCGHCGKPLYVMTGNPRRDGTFARRYGCASHTKEHGRGRCDAQPIDADTAEAMVIASINALLIHADNGQSGGEPGLATIPETAAGQRRLREAVLAGDERQIADAIKGLFEQMQPEAALIRDTALSQRQARELSEARRLQTWIDAETNGRTDRTRAEARELNKLLRKWFLSIELKVDPELVTITATRRQASGRPGSQTEVSISRSDWARFARPQRRLKVRYSGWDDSEIIGALQAWADVHGRSPTWSDWARSAANHPASRTLRDHFGTWNSALEQAGLQLQPTPQPQRHTWDDLDMIEALTSWTGRHGRPPTSIEWLRAEPEHPSTTTVRAHFGSWDAALAASGLEPEGRPSRGNRPWDDRDIINALKRWTTSHGHPPAGIDWLRATPDQPSTGTVRTHFGSWKAALTAAEL
jgi:DNA invertase Pin-like site-specific DNA recombinase